jgi:transcriptional regulator with XRE-family HTH domain
MLFSIKVQDCGIEATGRRLPRGPDEAMKAVPAEQTSRFRVLSFLPGAPLLEGTTHGNGERLRDLREEKNMSQGDVEKRTGLLRCYISRVENGHTVPSVETLEKLARALEIPTYRLFTADAQVEKPNISPQDIPSVAVNTKQDRELQVFAKLTFSRE